MNLEEIKVNMNRDMELSSYATKNKEAIRFSDNGEENDIRPPYFHDVDRIIYSLAYTRYINKTQVYSNVVNDNISKRMTHVQMVSKIARTIGRALKLNEDLIEAAALGHDIGHTPFGHAGEAILNKISLEHKQGYFNHNIQSVRNLMFIDNGGRGCNLTLQVLDAIMCHNGELELQEYRPKKKTRKEFLEEYYASYNDKEVNAKLIPMTLEGCVVRISDIIAYLGKDIEDALRLHKLQKEEIPVEITNLIGHKNRDIVNAFVMDIIENSYGKDYICMSASKFKILKELKKFNYQAIYSKANSKEQLEKWDKMFRFVFDKYLMDLRNGNESSHIYTYFYKYMSEEYKKETPLERVVIDYIAGMTDEFMLREYELCLTLIDN